MVGGTIVSCVEKTCAYCVDKRCIAERVEMVSYLDEDSGLKGLTCDTYEHRDSWIPEPEEDDHSSRLVDDPLEGWY